MKQRAGFAIIVLAAIGALVVSEKRKAEAPVGPEAFLYFLADTQRELTRLPVSFLPLSDQEEIKTGDRLAKFYLEGELSSSPDNETQAIEGYVQRVGARVAANAHRKLPYKFHYLPNYDFANAFALPGGHVFVGAGIMLLLESEDGLAALLGHEVEHIDHRHCAERVQIEAALRKIPLGELVELPVEVFTAGYSKDQELEADREGTRLAVAASYSPRGALQLFEAFQRIHQEQERRPRSPQEELSKVAEQTLEGYFRSHPLPAERIAQIQRLFADELRSATSTRPLEFAYVFLTERASRALGDKHYDEAAKLASQSVVLQPDYVRGLVILAEARFALGDFKGATEAYRNLVEKLAAPEPAASVTGFADGLAEEALKAQHYEDAEKFAIHSLELEPNHREGLATLAEAQLALGDFAGASATGNELKTLYPQAVKDVVDYASFLVDWTIKQGQFERAAKMASVSLDLNPDQSEMLEKMASLEFAITDFSAAAGWYRKLIETFKGSFGIALIRSYADALGADVRTPAEVKLRQLETAIELANSPEPAFVAQMRVERAGLKVMAGDESEAQALIAEGNASGAAAIAPESLARLAWWYYRAGKYTASESLLGDLLRQRPGDQAGQIDLAWDELELGRADLALQRFAVEPREAVSGSPLLNLPAMGRALAGWQIHRSNPDLDAFDSVTKDYPQWLNPKWVQSLYSPVVVRSVAEMQAASEQRAAERKRRQLTRLSLGR